MPEIVPQWVHVWFWLRFVRDPQVMTPLPHQGINPDAMTMERYEELENEWAEAGGKTTSAKQILMAMGAQATEYEELPF